MTLIKGWHTRQLDFILAYTHADCETELYMDLPKGFTCAGSRTTHALKLLKNLYGQKKAGRVWNQYLTKTLVKLGFVQSQVDECIFYYKHSVFMVFTDDTILVGPDQQELNDIVKILSANF